MMDCPKEELISAYVDDALDASTKQNIEVHLRSCSICQERVRKFEKLNSSLQEWADNRVQVDSEISASYEDVVPSHLEKMTIPESDKIFNRLVRKLQNTPQKVLWFRPQHFGIREEYLMRNQKLEEQITPHEQVQDIAAYSATSLYCDKLSHASRDFEFKIVRRIEREDLAIFISGGTDSDRGRHFKISLIPESFLTELGLIWDIQQERMTEEGDPVFILTGQFNRGGRLVNERIAIIPPTAEELLLKHLANGRKGLVKALNVEVKD